MAAECSRTCSSLEIPKEVLTILAAFSKDEYIQPVWNFSKHGYGCRLKLVWKTKSVSWRSPNNAHSSSGRINRNRRRMDAFLAKKKGLITRDDCTLNGTSQSSHTQVFRAVNKPLNGTPSQGPLMENNSTQSKATNPNKGIPEPSNVSSISITSNLPAAEPPSLDAVDYCIDSV